MIDLLIVKLADKEGHKFPV